MDTATLTNLQPGTIWKREREVNGEVVETFTTVLFITNQTLKTEKARTANPPQVVFRTHPSPDSDKAPEVLSMGIESFLKNRTFHDVDEGAEAMLNALMAPADEEEEIDLDDLEIEEDGEEAQLGQEPGLDLPEEASPIAAVTARKHFQGPSIDLPEQHVGLVKAFTGYSEAMFNGDTLHILKFTLSDAVTLDILREAFNVSKPNSVQKLSVTSCSGNLTTTIDVDGFLEVFLESGPQGDVGLVHVTSLGDIRESSATPSDQQVEDAIVVKEPNEGAQSAGTESVTSAAPEVQPQSGDIQIMVG